MGFGQQLIDFFQAIFVNANSSIIINGRIMEAFDITCFVRQGCPLLPAIFITVIEGLSCMLEDTLSCNRHKGIRF